MTYTFKLSRRLAVAYLGPMLLSALVFLAGCSSSELTTASDPEVAAYRTDFDGALRERDTTRAGGKAKAKGRRDDTANLVKLVVSPDPASVAIGTSTRFAAKGVLSDGSTTSVKVKWTATGGTIDSTGLYTANSNSGTFRVLATNDSSAVADTAAVTVSAQQPSVTAITLSPASVTLAPGGTQRFSASAKLSDGTTDTVDVTFSATGGTITNQGSYTAGSTEGTFRVVAKASGGTLADTSAVVIAAPAPAPSPPPPSGTGTTYFLANAENGDMSSWSLPWGVKSDGTNPVPSNTSARARSGGRSYKYEITSPSVSPHTSQTLSGGPQVSMGSPNGRYLSGYYSFWTYVDAGYTAPGWNMLLGWMTGVTGAPSPISHLELRVWNGALQLNYVLKNCAVGLYACPTISGYENQGGYYFMTPQSPAGIKAFPRGQWVHVAAYYKMSPTNGQVKVWQDGQLIMDLTAPTMNTVGGHSIEPLRNSAGDMMLQFGIYGGPKTDGTQRLYVDDFKVTDYLPVP
jgi:hypothetical protein